jgi:hypothetical protein
MIRSGCDMGVSRDALNWKICSELGLGHYIRHGKTIDGAEFTGGEVANGIIRRGDELFHYVNCTIANGGTTTVRFAQRLDGFLSLDAGDEPGTFITRPFVFEGDKLVLNVAAVGSVRVGIMALHGKPYTGYNVALTNPPKGRTRNYGITDCDAISTDSVRHVVTWKGDSEVGNLAGQVVRLRFEMQNAKLYSLQFEQ